MAIASLASLRAKAEYAQRQQLYKTGQPMTNGRNGVIYDQSTASGLPTGASVAGIGINGVLLSRTSAGALPLTPAGSGQALYLLGVNAQVLWDSSASGQYVIPTSGVLHVWDRLWINDSIASNTTARRSWSPGALTRYTSGEGLSIWYKQFGSGSGSGTITYTLEYTNQAGTATSVEYTWNHAAPSFIANVNQMVAVPLRRTDSGVRAVTAVTQSSTILSGSYGFAIQKYLGAYPLVEGSAFPSINSIMAGMPQVDNNAYLCFGVQLGGSLNNSFASNQSPTLSGELLFVEG
jgi:hypothetical protein